MTHDAIRTPPRSVLVIVTRRIGDVLLATPLVRSLKRAWPHCAVDMLVFEGTQGIVAANPDLRRVLTIAERPGWLRHLAFALTLLRRYDVALSPLQGDRPTLYAFLAGRWRAGLLTPTRRQSWKQSMLHAWRPFDDSNTHTVRMVLALASVLDIAAGADVVVSWSAEEERELARLPGAGGAQPLAVLHPYPRFNYKMWRPESWIEVAHRLAARGFRLALTGGSDVGELAYVTSLAAAMPPGTLNAAGKLSLGAAVCLVAGARLYVGTDTAMTHVAAALGVPTVALFGPTNCVKWGPWPRGHAAGSNPWSRCGSQRSGNVVLVQGAGACVPCHLEGCDRHIDSYSDCLQQLPAAQVIAAIEQLLDRPTA